ncbi:MAG TPA: hypothetical protein VFD77_03485 [Brumimicrobium sp.]|nr:hypothetical protein [Brumimicrobium sp.]
MNKQIITPFFSLLLLFVSVKGFSQERDSLNLQEIDSPINYYTQLSVGLNNPMYRDFATSPLFYSGFGLDLSAAWLKRADKRERIFEIGLGISAQSPRVPESNFIQAGGLAIFGNLRFFYQELWKLEALSNAKNNTKVGGAVITTQNIRVNTALQNNAMGLENLLNIMASAQWTRDISRTEAKQLKLWFIKPTLKPVKRDLRFLLNVGVLNFNYRPGYAYSYDSEMNGTDTNPVSWVFSNYKWSLNGFRLKTQLEYIKYLPNGNARSLSYVWEAAHAPGKHEAFQMASHRLQYTIHFHTKKR